MWHETHNACGYRSFPAAASVGVPFLLCMCVRDEWYYSYVRFNNWAKKMKEENRETGTEKIGLVHMPSYYIHRALAEELMFLCVLCVSVVYFIIECMYRRWYGRRSISAFVELKFSRPVHTVLMRLCVFFRWCIVFIIQIYLEICIIAPWYTCASIVVMSTLCDFYCMI